MSCNVSVILPAHNVEAFVGEAVGSVIAQGMPDLEVIAVDDGSTDATAAVLDHCAKRADAAGMRMIVIRGTWGGAGAARNAALDRARGRYIVFVDADDRLHPGALRRLTGLLDEEPGVDLAFPLCRYVDHRGDPLDVVSTAAVARFRPVDLLVDNPIHTGTGVTVRRDRVEAVGRFDTQLPAYIDIDFWLRLTAGRGDNIAAVPEVLVDYRKRPGQITSEWRRMRAGWEACVRLAEASGYGLTPRRRREALARNALTWSTIAYQHGDFVSARRLATEFWRNDPRLALRSGDARVRTMACLASLMPSRLHDVIRSRYNGR